MRASSKKSLVNLLIFHVILICRLHCYSDEPKAKVIYNEFHPPLPRVSKRDIVAMKIWVPHGLSRDMKCGEITFMIPNKILRPLKSVQSLQINVVA